MYKYLSVFVIGGILGWGCANSDRSEAVACHNAVAAASPAMAMGADLSEEHVRHMRSRRQVAEIEEAPKTSEVSVIAELPKPAVDETPTGSIKPVKQKKAKLHFHKKKNAVDTQEPVAEAQLTETERSAPRGFFESLFSGN
jgi:hypothetical protein